MPRVAGVILAAGGSRRFGDDPPKQLARFAGEPLVRRAARTASRSRLRELYAVVGYRGEAVASVLAGLAVSVIENPHWQEGQSASVRAAVARLPATVDAAMFLPCDQPLLTVETIDRLLAAYEAGGGSIFVPVAAGRRGAPVVIGRELFPDLARLTGDEGARQLFGVHQPRLVEVEIVDGRALRDVDSPATLARLATEGFP